MDPALAAHGGRDHAEPDWQEAIETALGMSHDMFRHVLALNTYTEPFLSLKTNDQGYAWLADYFASKLLLDI